MNNVSPHIESSINFAARKKAAWISLFASVVVLTLKGYAWTQTHSAAILSDALESIVNVVTALVALFVISYVSQPADEEHPYGHGKAEYFSAAFEGGLIFFAAIMIIFEGVRALVAGSAIHEIESGLFIVVIATVFNLALGFYLKRVGNKEKSETLLASGAHVLSDVKTTIGVVIALLVVKFFGWLWFDSLMAIAVALHLAYEGFTIVKKSIGGLIDETDQVSLGLLSTIFIKHRQPGIIDIHHLRAIRSGSFHHVDAHVVIPEFWDIAKAHEAMHEFENKVVSDYPYDGEIAFHIDPCNKQFCGKCDLQNCSIRAMAFEKIYSFEVKDMVRGPQKTN